MSNFWRGTGFRAMILLLGFLGRAADRIVGKRSPVTAAAVSTPSSLVPP
jgi:hypothetical protein